MSDMTAAVDTVYQNWCKAWRTLDTDLMLSLFDLQSDDLAYQSEENEGPLVGGVTVPLHSSIAECGKWSISGRLHGEYRGRFLA